MVDLLAGKLNELAALCREYGVLRLDVFGSAAKGTFDPETSDLDVLYTYANHGPDGHVHRFLEFAESLERLFVRKVDLVCDEAVRNPYFREELERTRRNVYLAPGEIAPPENFQVESPATVRSRWMKQHLFTALTASHKIAAYTADLDFEGYAASELHQAATTQQVCVLGRALRRLEELQPGLISGDAPFREVMELGLRVSEDYRAVNHGEIWEKAVTQAEALKRRTAALLEAA
jgi:predicted nucleotidyltransferase/uncharacterized protein with HEPN domain